MAGKALKVSLDEVLAILVAKDALMKEHPEVDHLRLTKGIALVLSSKVALRDGIWQVRSQSDGRKSYAVDVWKGTCNCPDHTQRGEYCKHLCAGYIAQCERQIFVEQAARQRRAMPRAA